MKAFRKIAVLGDTRLLKEAREQIAELSEQPVIFPEANAINEAELIKRTGDADAILFSWGTKITSSYLDACPSIKYIGVCATTLGDIDIDDVKRRSITLRNVTDYGDEATAEWIISQLLMYARGEGKLMWREEPTELTGKTIGIIGLGAVGQQLAKRALALDMKVLYTSRTRKLDWETRGLKYVELPELLSSSQIISVHVPRNTMVLGPKEFALIPKDTVLVETSIGNVIDEAAFIEWIGRRENVVIMDYSTGDKYYRAFSQLQNIIFPKKIAGMTHESRQRLGNKVIANMKQYLQNSA